MNIWSKIANLLSIASLIVFVVCVFMIGTNSFPEVANPMRVGMIISWSMIGAIVLGFFLQIQIAKEENNIGWQVVSIMPLIGAALFLFMLT